MLRYLQTYKRTVLDDMINCGEIDDDVEIKVTKSGKFVTQMHVAP